MKSHWFVPGLLAILLGSCSPENSEVRDHPAVPAEPIPEPEPAFHEQEARLEARHRSRRILINNDGNDALYKMHASDDPEMLPSLRGTQLIDTQVDTLFYCTISSGFGQFIHDTKLGVPLVSKEAINEEGDNTFAHNHTAKWIAEGRDALRVMSEFAASNGIEFFWSMRMNDVHDGSTAWHGDVLFDTNTIKTSNPGWLLGKRGAKLKAGAWSGIDYTVPEVRELAAGFVQEVVENYEVDGVELDFWRHPYFFPSTTRGEPCTEGETALMTKLIREVRSVLARRAAERKRPQLLAVRLPDSADYCRRLGLDIETWLEQDLVDLLIVGGYFQLRPWESSVSLGRLHDVPVYPALDDVRFADREAKKTRFDVATFRARAFEAHQAGASGVYLYNFPLEGNTYRPLLRQMGDFAGLAQSGRWHFASFRGHPPSPYRADAYLRIPAVNPSRPARITHAGPVVVDWGNRLGAIPPGSRLLVRAAEHPLSGTVEASWNGTALHKAGSEGSHHVFSLPTGEPPHRLELRSSVKSSHLIPILDVRVEIAPSARAGNAPR